MDHILGEKGVILFQNLRSDCTSNQYFVPELNLELVPKAIKLPNKKNKRSNLSGLIYSEIPDSSQTTTERQINIKNKVKIVKNESTSTRKEKAIYKLIGWILQREVINNKQKPNTVTENNQKQMNIT